MKFYVKGDFTKKEFIRIGNFFRQMFSNTDKVVNIIVTEGTEDMSKEEVAALLVEIFKDSPSYHMIIIEKDKS